MLDAAAKRLIHRRARLARRFEARVTALARAGELDPTLHSGAGQELCQLAALAALRADDPMLYGHRGTGYFLARGISLVTLLCDLAYREGGTNRGKGGLMHVVDIARGVLGESGTLGGNFVIGAGVALADKLLGRDAVTIVFFGDGAANRGQFHEALNFASLKRLPVIFFCENNGYGLSTPVAVASAEPQIARRAAGYAMPGVTIDGGDVEAVYAATAAAGERARSGGGPSLIEARVLRLHGHYLGDREVYRSDADRAELAARDPLPRFERALQGAGLLTRAELDAIEAEIDAEIDAAVAELRRRPLVSAATATESVYSS
jgi:pyruvate dehydrogenase E1 component alpha subunit